MCFPNTLRSYIDGGASMEPLRYASEDAYKLIRESEGLSLHVYKCPAGFPTIGYGHRLLSDESPMESITKDQAEAILMEDVGECEKAIHKLVHAPLTQGQFDALVDFVFNLGAGHLEESTLLVYLNDGKYDAACAELPKWRKSGKQVLPGLVKRRAAEVELWNKKEG